MLKTSFTALAICIAGAFANEVYAQQHFRSFPNKAEAISYDMLVSQYNFPVKKHTGNPDLDQQVYAADKKKWIAANQALYNRYNRQGIKSDPEQRRKEHAILRTTK